MTYLFTVFVSCVFSFVLFIPLRATTIQASAYETKMHRLEQSTFDPVLRGKTSEAWDYERIERSTFNPKFQGVTSEELDAIRLEHSTSNPDFQGTTSKELDEIKLERSPFNPDFQGTTSEEADKIHRLKYSTFNPAYQGINSLFESDSQRNFDAVPTIRRNNFSGRIRSVHPSLPSIRADFSSDRYLYPGKRRNSYPVQNSYPEGIIR